MKKKILTFVFLLIIAGIVMIAGHEIERHMHKAEQNTETTEVPVDYSLYYTYADVEKVVGYLADTKAESEALSRLIDPLKKSEVIDVAFVKSVAQVIQVKTSIYEEALNGKKDSDYVTKAEFEDFYERIVASATVKGLLRKDVLVLAISEENKTSFSDGQDTYNAEFEIDETYEGNVLDVYMKNGMIFKINSLGNSEITLQNVWVKEISDGMCTFLYGNLEKTYPVRREAELPDSGIAVATSLDADRQTVDPYETDGYVANLVFNYAGICKIERPQKILRGRVISTADTQIQVEKIGGLTLADHYKMYNVYEDAIDEESLSLLTGYSYVDMYLQDGKVGAVVINQKLKTEDIRVIISNDDYTSYEMEMVQLTATTAFTVTNPDDTETKYQAGDVVTIEASGYEEDEVLKVEPDTHSGRIKLLSVTRECGNPEYDGLIELDVQDGYIYVINELSLERYLANVVANAMPSDYPDAAMQAMAICTRGIAYAKLKDESYAEYHAHLDDSSLCQVYNNVAETDESIRAVKDTYGLVPTYHGTLIVPMTFNTSFGTTCTNAEIWGGDSYSYLESNVENLDKSRIDLSDEKDFVTFLTDSEAYNIIDKDSPYYRWDISFTQEEMTEAVEMALTDRKSVMEDSIQVEDENGAFISAELPKLGTITSIEVAERSASGVVTRLLIRGSEHAVSISGQSNIRAILNPVHQEIVRQDGSTIIGWTSLPSPYYYVEQTERGFVVHGGGFGHGAGMSIYGAGVLGRQGKNYKYILRHYFSYIDFASIYTMDDQDSGETTQTEQE